MASDLTWSQGLEGPTDLASHTVESAQSAIPPFCDPQKLQPFLFSGVHKIFSASGLGTCVKFSQIFTFLAPVNDSGLSSNVSFVLFCFS